MKWVVRGFLVLITLAFLVLAGATYMLVAFDPNDYKDRLASAVTKATGRTFAIDGDIKATMFPVLGLDIANIRMGNPEGFGGGDFLAVAKMQAGVKIAPLFEKRIELTKITLVEPSINIIRNADGKTNMEFPRAEKTAVTTSEPGAAPMDFSIEQIEISNARAVYNDKAKGETWTVHPLNMTIPGFKPGDSTPVSIDMAMNKGDGMTVTVKGGASMKAAPQDGKFTLSGAQADIGLQSPALSGPLTVAVRGDMELDQKAETLSAKNLKLTWQGTDITSEITVKNFKKPAIAFTASAPAVDIDALTSAFAKKDKATDGGKDAIPFDLIRTLTLDGTIGTDTLKVAGLSATGVKAKINANGGTLKIAPVTATLYEGALDAKITVNANGTPSVNAAGALQGVQVGPVLQAKMGHDYITGKAGLDFNLRGAGRSMNDIRSSAAGSFGFDFGEGYINKWQLSKLINQAIAYFETGKMDENASDKIYFTSLDGTFTGQNGVFRNSDLILLAPKSHALGSGTISLAQQSVDYSVRVGLGDDPEKFAQATHLPIRIAGPLAKPQYTLDMQALLGEKIEEKKQELLDKALDKLSGKDKKAAQQPAAADGAAPAGEAAPDAAAPAAQEEPDPREQLLRGLFGQ